MRRFQILIYSCLVCVFLDSCCIPIIQKRFYTTEYGSDRPKKNKFKLAKKTSVIQNKDFISENYVYQSTFNMDMENKELKNKYTTFFRFFKNGKFLRNGLKDTINPLKEYNNLRSGTIGYFEIIGNEIILEKFSVGAHDCGQYHQYKLKIIGDSIEGYNKIKVEGLKGTPDW